MLGGDRCKKIVKAFLVRLGESSILERRNGRRPSNLEALTKLTRLI